jgi:type II secretory pathway component GspD/PulD (secretin)
MLVLVSPNLILGQRPRPASGFGNLPVQNPSDEGAEDEEPLVELNLAGSVSLPRLVEAVSKQLDIRFLYSADLANRQVTVYTPARLPRSALLALLGSLLKGENLAIVDSDVAGWKRIVDVADMVPHATPGQASEILKRDGPAAAVTQVIPIQNADISKLAQALRPFLSRGANFLALPENRLIIVTDYAQNVKTMSELLKLIDEPTGQAVLEFYETKNRTPASLIDQVESLIAKSGTPPDASVEVRLFNDASGRRVVVAGPQARVDQILRLLQQLDTGMDFLTRVYRLQNVSADRIDKLIRGLVSSEDADKTLETTIDADGNLLIVRAPADVHQQIETLIAELDLPVDTTESPIQFYKLKNANAIEVLYSLLALQQVSGSGVQPAGYGLFGTVDGGAGGVMAANGMSVPAGMGVVPSMGVNVINNPGYLGDTGGRRVRMPFDSGYADDPFRDTTMQNQNEELRPLIAANAPNQFGYGGLGYGGYGGGVGLAGGQVAYLPGGARISADVATNSLIVLAPASIQPIYERLIRSLDLRRPQVMIEAEIVAVDTSNNFSLGVEVSIGDRTGIKKLYKFTSFGLSEVDPISGMLTPNPGLGFNGVLLDPDVADVIVQALSRHTRVKVLASPKILVNDNQTGTLESVASFPFSSINVVNTIGSSSLGGEQQAGTIITVTPHINEDNHLQLEFDVEFSSFEGDPIPSGGEFGGVLPPARRIDRVGSVVTIPDGKTVVVGGLKRTRDIESFSGVPWTEHIPVLRELTSLTGTEQRCISFFLFIRPKILRDSQFRDLRYLSDLEIQEAQVPGDAPVSRPLIIPCETSPNAKSPVDRRGTFQRGSIPSNIPVEVGISEHSVLQGPSLGR